MNNPQELKSYQEYLVNWLKEQVKKTNCKGLIVGISGGIDSALVAALATKACGSNTLGVIMPIGNMSLDLDDAQKVIKTLKMPATTIDLTSTYQSLTNALKIDHKLALANIKPRLRMSTLYALAQQKNYLVLGTDNKAEWMLGYFTKHGDGGVDLLPIVHLKKHEVYQLAKMLNLPESVLVKKPSAGLWPGQYDEDELGFSYQEVDRFLANESVKPEIKAKIKKQIQISAHKREPLPAPLAPSDFQNQK